MSSPAPLTPADSALVERYRNVRRLSERICEPLEIEDYVVQTMDDVSPPKWHLAHTSWFFETFLLKPYSAGYREFQARFNYLFNSYYEAVGERHPRPRRGLLSRPTVAQVYEYRRHVDDAMAALLGARGDDREIVELVELGLNHEQQHQELLLTDLKHILAANPLDPLYRARGADGAEAAAEFEWIEFPGGIEAIGFEGEGFCFDNERPRHEALLRPFGLASRLTTNEEFLEFVEDGGYRDVRHWLSLGWATVLEKGWEAPLYWRLAEGRRQEFTLAGLAPLEPHAPVCHVSYFEAAAFASWAGKRLATEAEWEVAARRAEAEGNFLDSGRFHPARLNRGGGGLHQMYGDVWEWTSSAYSAYPGYRAPAGAIGEYNGKFMCNQYVLRGGSCATPSGHVRATYRNFFPPEARWQFSGIRLAT